MEALNWKSTHLSWVSGRGRERGVLYCCQKLPQEERGIDFYLYINCLNFQHGKYVFHFVWSFFGREVGKLMNIFFLLRFFPASSTFAFHSVRLCVFFNFKNEKFSIFLNSHSQCSLHSIYVPLSQLNHILIEQFLWFFIFAIVFFGARQWQRQKLKHDEASESERSSVECGTAKSSQARRNQFIGWMLQNVYV